MKWLGQYIIDLKARFRSLIYLEDTVYMESDIYTTGLQNPGADLDGFVVRNSDTGRLGFRTGSEVGF